MAKSTVIAIVGASASGKSLFASTIYQELIDELGGEQIAVVAEDSYYRNQDHLPMEQRVQTNYDHPSAFDHELLAGHLEQLRGGQAVEMPQYCYLNHTRKPETVTVQPAKVILVEGILLLTDVRLLEHFDIKVFIDTPLDICLLRRIRRDTEERGRTLISIIDQYERQARPAFLQFIEPCKPSADLVVTRGGKNKIAIDIIKTKIRTLLA